MWGNILVYNSYMGYLLPKKTRKQRRDIVLNIEIANAIREYILSGSKIYSKKGFIEIYTYPHNEEKALILRTSTINSWITRRNTIPEIGVSLKDYINSAKEEYRIKKENELKKILTDLARLKIKRLMKLKTSKVLRDKNGVILLDEDGYPIKKENITLLKLQIDTAKFLFERLYLSPHALDENTGFSLADLRKLAR